jgi:hypothetical protein
MARGMRQIAAILRVDIEKQTCIQLVLGKRVLRLERPGTTMTFSSKQASKKARPEWI